LNKKRFQRDFDLYFITDRHQTLNRPLSQVIESAISGGVQSIQLREKDLPLKELLSLAVEIRERTLHKSLLFINERADVCLASGADGVHLRSDSIPPSAVRKILGVKRLIGVSCHSLEELRFAESEGADFATLGPLFFTPSKQKWGMPMGLGLFQTLIEKVKIPVYGLGGVGLEQVRDVMRAGASGVAMISAISTSRDVKETTENVLAEIYRTKIHRQ
jgi:thiamine-phosphate pyrophosphorylase